LSGNWTSRGGSPSTRLMTGSAMRRAKRTRLTGRSGGGRPPGTRRRVRARGLPLGGRQRGGHTPPPTPPRRAHPCHPTPVQIDRESRAKQDRAKRNLSLPFRPRLDARRVDKTREQHPQAEFPWPRGNPRFPLPVR
jgi:hypothetical protein